MDFSQQQQQQQQHQQQQQQQQYHQQQQQQQLHDQTTYGNLSLGSLPDPSQHIAAGGGWYPHDISTQPSIQVQNFRSTGTDAVDNMTTWTPSYASVGGNELASAYSASLADIAEEGDATMGGTTNSAFANVAYDPLISDTYDLPQFGQNMSPHSAGAAGQAGFQTGGNGMDFSTLLGGQLGWNQQGQQIGQGSPFATGGSLAGRAPSSDAGQSGAFLSTHASHADSSMSPGASSASVRPGSASGIGFDGAGASSGQNLAGPVASWARSASVGQDKLNMALDQVHISDENRYQSVFADDNDTQPLPQGARTDQLRSSLPSLNTSLGGMSMDLDVKGSGPKSADIAAALAQWASTASGMPSPAAAEAIYRAAAFGEYLTAGSANHTTQNPTNDNAGPCKTRLLSLQTSALPPSDPSSLSAQLRNLTPIDGSFDLRSLAQPMRSESFDKIKLLINDGRVFTPTSASAPGASFGLPASAGGMGASGANQTDSTKKSPKDFIVELFNSTGLDAQQSQLVFDQLQQQAQGLSGDQESEQTAQAHLAMLALIGEGLGHDMSTEQWDALGLKGFGDPQRAVFAAAVLGQDLTVMPMRYGLATSDTRTQIGDGATTEGSTTTAGGSGGEGNHDHTMDPSLLQNRRDSTLGPMRQRNWSSSGRARPFGASGGNSDPYRTQGPNGNAGPSYLGSSSSHPYGAPDALQRSASERSSARRHRRNAKSEDLTRMAQEGNVDYVHHITGPDGMLAPPSAFAGPSLMAPGPTPGQPGGNASTDGYTSSAAYTGQYQSSPHQNASSASPLGGNASDGTPSLDGSRSAGAASAMGSPATTWTGSPSGGSGHGSMANNQTNYANIHALTSSAAAQQVAAAQAGYGFPGQGQGQGQGQALPSFLSQPPVSVPPAQYSQTSAPMYGHLVPPSKASQAGMLPPDQGHHPQQYAGAGGIGPMLIPGPANHVSAATQAASAARRKTEASFECPIPGCGSTFTRKNNLDGHLRSHNNVRPFACPVPGCDKRFARRHDMNRHHDLHTNKKQHVCELCNRRFARLDALNRHLKNTNGTCAAGAGGGDAGEEDDDEEGAGESNGPAAAPFGILGSSSSTSDPAHVPSKVELVAEPASTTAGVEVAISAPTPSVKVDEDEPEISHFGNEGVGAGQHVQIPILVTPSRQNSGASSGGGAGGSGPRFRGYAL
ncbi:unnamed protein product [Tilletia controversa]|uniref:C2H2-type domain-containing protein n=1 Tax=Tilletia controversa TaxID=13291 RepID=A0A8X7MT64_9BASI|nr:hypothetical protein A4X06_0g4763 [Tilletia controversa]CAD6977395.1 unnamed protein product [Tilletia controversa]